MEDVQRKKEDYLRANRDTKVMEESSMNEQ